jgi:hypothetical protein
MGERVAGPLPPLAPLRGRHMYRIFLATLGGRTSNALEWEQMLDFPDGKSERLDS